MTDELRPDPAEMNGKTADAQTAGTTGAPAAEPDRTMVMNTDSVDRTLVMDCDSPDRTIVLSPENGITRANPEDTQAIGGKQRTRIHTILHTPTSILSALTGAGTGKRDVGAKIDGMDRHRERAEVGHMDETQAHLTDVEDRFEIERKLAEGGRYTVSIGEDLGLEREVAVYSLRDEKLMDEDERLSFIS